jgi:subtilisin family serine protease
MKKTIILSALMAAFAISANAQTLHNSQKFHRSGQNAYLVENSDTFTIEQSVLVVKPKKNAILSKDMRQLRASKLGFMSIEVPKDVRIEDYAREIEASGKFEYVEYNTKGYYFMTPNDAYYGNQWYLDSISAPMTWDIATGSPNVRMAIIDSGVDAGHSDLGYGSDNHSHVSTTEGYNYVNNCIYSTPLNKHGTMVAGVAGAKTNNATGISGVCGGNNSKGLTIIPYCVGNDTPDGDMVAYAIVDAVDKGAKVINLSLGGFLNNSYLESAINYAYNHGVSIICASGNGVNHPVSFPASHEKTIAVGSIQQNNLRPFYSNFGTGLDLVAPGVGIYSTTLNNSYESLDGTSFASPQVAGAVAIMLSIDSLLPPDSIRQILHATATHLAGYNYSNNWNNETGYGRLNTYEAVKAVAIRNLEIVGASQLCGSEIYYVKNLPPGLSVEWSFEYTGNSPDSLLQSDYPTNNQCIVNIENNENLDETLVANVYEGTTLIKTLSKHISTGWSFSGTYKHYNLYNIQVGSSHNFGNGDVVWASVSYNVIITSSLFDSSVISHTLSPNMFWIEQTNPRRIRVVFSTNGRKVTVTGENTVPCNNFKFTIRSMNHPPLPLDMVPNVDLSDNTLTISNRMFEESPEFVDGVWSIGIFNVMTGRRVYYDIINRENIQIDTSSWVPGVYVIKMIINDQIYTQKLNVKC